MQSLRRMTFLARLVLAGFLLSLGAAVAAPAVKPRALEKVCGSGVFKWVAPDEGAGGRTVPSALDCPLCGLSGPPPVDAAAPGVIDWGPAMRLARAHQPFLPALAVLPPPARAPPATR